jgi:hypothetical protein
VTPWVPSPALKKTKKKETIKEKEKAPQLGK